MNQKPKFLGGKCACELIANFRPEKPGMCGPGKRYSVARGKCRTFKGCGPGRRWSNRNWGCVGELKCKRSETWNHEIGKC